MLKIVAQRVADKKIAEIFDGVPRTDGINIWLPIRSRDYNFDEKIGIASHEGAHIRFKSVFGTNLHVKICPKNPQIGFVVLNLLEDKRINILLKEAYMGFWIELNKADMRMGGKSLDKLKATPINVLNTDWAIDFLLNLIILHMSGREELIFHKQLQNKDGQFKFSSKSLGNFWVKYLKSFEYLISHLTFSATIIAGKMLIEAFNELLKDLDEEKPIEKPRTITPPPANRPKQQILNIKPPGGKSRGNSNPNKDSNRQVPSRMPQSKQVPSKIPQSKQIPSKVMQIKPQISKNKIPESQAKQIKQELKEIAQKILRSISTQKLNIKMNNSGIPFNVTEKALKDTIQKLIKKLETNGDDIDKLKKSMKKQLNKERKDIQGILDDIQNKPTAAGNGNQESTLITCNEEGRSVIVDVLDGIKEIKNFNNITDPAKEYRDIVTKNYYLIKQLWKAFAKIRVNKQLERGTRRGLICNRDLARVVSSKGKFNRPFMSHHKTAGASLLILVDESVSMSEDEIQAYVYYNEDRDCPFIDECEAFKKCPDKDYCDCCGYYPKGYDWECERTRDCLMIKHMESIENGTGAFMECLPIYIAKKSVIILAEALKETSIDLSIIGFSAIGGKEEIVEKVYKRFGEEVNPDKLGAMWVSFESGENRDGTSLKSIASRHFKNTQNRCPIMIVISDGEPHHGGTKYVGDVAANMTADAVKYLMQNIKMYALSIDKRGQDYLKDIYGSENYIVLRKPKEITQKLINLVKNVVESLVH
ncbi:MAG: hypothetical protein ACFFCS_16645 [Candidatus Hodarchaeota archaeon]